MKAKDLAAALALPLDVARRRVSPMAILEHVRLAGGKAAANTMAVAANKLDAALNGIAAIAGEQEVKFALRENRLVVSAPGVRHTLPTMPPEDLPMPQWPTETKPIGDWKAFVAALEFALPSAAKKDVNRPFLCGVAVKDGYIGSSDGHRGAMAAGEAQIADTFIIPTDAVSLVAALPGGKSYSFNENTLVINFEGGRFSLQLVAHPYPDLARIVPAAHGKRLVRVEREPLLRAAESVTRSRYSVHLRLTAARGQVKLESSGDEGTATVDLQASEGADGWEVAMNADYVKQAIAALEGDQITLSQEEDGKPVMLTGKQESRRVVIMPWRT